MPRFLATAALATTLTGCATLSPVTEHISLAVRSYDQTTGAFVLELRNHSTHPVLYLNPYLTFHVTRSPRPEPFPKALVDTAFVIHDALLSPGESLSLSGNCTAVGPCSRPHTYVAVRACWYTEAWTCKEYLPIWSVTPLNGA